MPVIGSVRSVAILLVCLVPLGFLSVGCGSSLPKRQSAQAGAIATSPLSVEKDSFSAYEPSVTEVSPRAPWEVWQDEDLNSFALRHSDQLASGGEIEKAIEEYRKVELSAESLIVTRAAFTRRLSNMLKLGRSKEVLAELSAHVSRSGQRIEDLAPELILLAAYAYRHRNNTDQLFAWVTLAQRQSQGRGVVADGAASLAREGVESLSNADFTQAADKWRADQFLSPLFSQEKIRRAEGGASTVATGVNWYSADSYRVNQSPQFERDDSYASSEYLPLDSATGPANYAIGVLLPLSGQYESHANQVKRGIELALEAMSEESRPQVFFEDTRGDEFVAAEAYQRLVDQHKVSLVLGPLLSRTTELVAQQSLRAGVPIISFTKRPGIPEIGQTIFRLGATNQGQVSDLISFAQRTLGVSKFAVLYPDNQNGAELADAFVEELERSSSKLVSRYAYNRDDELSLKKAVSIIDSSEPEAVFIPDTIESAYPLLVMLRAPTSGVVEQDGQQLRRLTLLGPAFWDDPVAIRGYGPLLDNSYYVSLFNLSSKDPYVIDFVNRFKNSFGSDPDILSAQGYDAFRLAAFVMRSGNTSTAAVTEALLSTRSFPGVTGLLTVERDGEIDRQMSIIRLFNGEASEVSQFGIEDQAPQGENSFR